MQTEKQQDIAGFLLINKPEQLTSFDCIRHIKKIINLRQSFDGQVSPQAKQKIKIGHTGTLDDFATGLLIIAIDRSATRIISSLMNLNKEYIITAKLGELTDSFDKTGKIIGRKERIEITETDLHRAIKQLGTSYSQIPPIYSALKHKGEALYRLVREKKLDQTSLEEIVKQKSRKIRIYQIELIDFSPPFFTIKTTVSKGTYARSLANDIAQILKLPATTYQLERTKIGPISLQNSVELAELKTIEDIKNNLISIEELKEKIITI